MRTQTLSLFVLIALVSACVTTTVPEAIRTPAPGNLSVADVQRNVDPHRGQPVRWGGTIASVENRKSETVIEIVARDLYDDGRPGTAGASPGRFLARVEGFLDPAIYAKNRDLTVAGTVAGSETRAIGEFSYAYPVVNAVSIHLWERLPDPRYVSPYYYDPYWHSYWDPWWRHPYYR